MKVPLKSVKNTNVKMSTIFKSPTVATINYKGKDEVFRKNEVDPKTPTEKKDLKKKFKLVKGMKVFLDLKNFPEKNKIESHLQKFGVVVDEFLSKDIDWLISNRDLASEKSPPHSLLTPKG